MARSGLVFLGCLLIAMFSTSACILDWNRADKPGAKDAETPRTDSGERPTKRDGGLDGAIDGAAPAEGGADDGKVGSTPDASDQRTIEDGGSIPGTDVTSGQIAQVRAAIRGNTAWEPLPIDGAVVTYVKRGFGNQPVGSADGPGLYVQRDDAGPALLIAMDPAMLVPGGVRVGDVLNLTVTAGQAPGFLVFVTTATARLVGEGAPLPKAQDISPLDLLWNETSGIEPGEHDLESELVSCTATIGSSFTSSGSGFSAARISTVGEPNANMNFLLRAPNEWVAAQKLFTGCTVSILGTPFARHQNKIQVPVWELADADVTCPPFTVLSIYPAATSDVPLRSPIRLTFNQPVEASVLTTQITAGSCTGAIQLSPDNFTTCLPFASANASMDSSNTIATMVPKDPFPSDTHITLRIASGIKAANGAPLSLSETRGFTTTAELGTCSAPVVISQVYGGGGNDGATLSHDFVELHNRGAAPISISGWSIQDATSSSWTVYPLPDVAIAGGGYYLIKGGSGGVAGAPLLGADMEGALTLGGRTGRLALVAGTNLTGSADDPLRLDLVTYGFVSSVDPSEGSPTAELSSTTAALRKESGCQDTNDNSSDFTVGLPAPRSSSSTSQVCGCSTVP